MLNKKKDPLGLALTQFYKNRTAKDVLVSSDVAEDELLNPAYFFRAFESMPKIEQKALELCKGKVLDVGAGAGCHASYLEDNGYDVKAIDISPGCVDVMKQRKLKQVQCIDINRLAPEKFDTLLLLMNGIGVAGTLKELPNFFKHLKQYIEPDGQILMDSSNLIYLYMNEDGSVDLDLMNSKYYGEITYQMKYSYVKGDPFNWLFVDEDHLVECAKEAGLTATKIMDGEHYDYLYKLEIA
ncbi:class I SAM-dependent methyltransferase [Puteibacter caeruleilacunae]|nr:class I SAM-dependent methyltransferase [Puteibacter caeruleilacunae]